MSTKLEWIDADSASVGFILPGEEAADGQEVDPAEGIAVQIVGDDGVAITGTPSEIRQLALRICRATFDAERTRS